MNTAPIIADHHLPTTFVEGIYYISIPESLPGCNFPDEQSEELEDVKAHQGELLVRLDWSLHRLRRNYQNSRPRVESSLSGRGKARGLVGISTLYR